MDHGDLVEQREDIMYIFCHGTYQFLAREEEVEKLQGGFPTSPDSLEVRVEGRTNERKEGLAPSLKTRVFTVYQGMYLVLHSAAAAADAASVRDRLVRGQSTELPNR